ncbi:hypothetical protein BH20VER1_BH20VER1_00130 [soil metagenome]
MVSLALPRVFVALIESRQPPEVLHRYFVAAEIR